jgi:hypothetical protein
MTTIPTILVAPIARYCAQALERWRPHGDSNPGYRRERARDSLTYSGSYVGAYYFSY